MSVLTDMLRTQIAAQGPISVAEYMNTCLLHPEHGYYTAREAIGAAGDFTTAPEISQMFGEMLGLCLAQAWLDQGQPARVILTELGPGRGTLMADVLRAAKAAPGFVHACEIHLIEASPRLRAEQARALQGHEPQWHDSVAELPSDAPVFALANEFFDALPIQQFIRTGDYWAERRIGLQGDTLQFGLAAPAPVQALQHRLEDTKEGDLVEICPTAPAILRELAQRIETHGGAALIFDYGDWRSLGDTLQAVRAHDSVDPLAHPGESDLTAHVDFEALVADLPCAHSRITPQGVVLERLGITARAQALAGKLQGDALDQHIAAHRRLTHRDEMGTIFKSVALFATQATAPAGYET